jgi:hypothetical protein
MTPVPISEHAVEREGIEIAIWLRFFLPGGLTYGAPGPPIENLNGLFSTRYEKIKNVTF